MGLPSPTGEMDRISLERGPEHPRHFCRTRAEYMKPEPADAPMIPHSPLKVLMMIAILHDLQCQKPRNDGSIVYMWSYRIYIINGMGVLRSETLNAEGFASI